MIFDIYFLFHVQYFILISINNNNSNIFLNISLTRYPDLNQDQLRFSFTSPICQI